VVLGGWLDSMILEVFSNLWFYDHHFADLEGSWDASVCPGFHPGLTPSPCKGQGR